MTMPATPAPADARTETGAAVFGHRGASLALQENTLAAFALAFEQGAEGVELDVALSADGVPVVMHDPTVDRTTDGVGAVARLTLGELRALDAGGEPVPTLDEVLALVARHGAEVNIEIKAGDAAAAVLEVVRRHPGLRWFASSFQWRALEELRALDPAARLYPLTLGVAGIDEMRETAIAAGYPREQLDAAFEGFFELSGSGLDEALAFAGRIEAEGLSVWEMRLAAADIERIHAAGLRAWVWTINDSERAAQLLRDGADAICTDDPAGIIAVRATLTA